MKNDYEIRGDIVVIFMNSPKYGKMETYVNLSKFHIVQEFKNKWFPAYEPKTNSFYANGNITIAPNKRRVYGLHQWIMGLPEGMHIDHFDHDTLNNTDKNLRIVTNAENRQNRKGSIKSNISGIRGVTWVKREKKWQVRMGLNGKSNFFGMFDSIEEAEKVATEARKKYMPFSLDAV